jgi:N6-adenosine-specific RNA methylase IME4
MNPKLGHYKTILADPPWAFQTYSERGKVRSAEQHYPCMTIDDIMPLPVASWAADDAVLLLWVTKPMLMKAHDVIRAWGFTYKTVGFTWVKLKKTHSGLVEDDSFFMGMGFWTRANPEQCLLATRGHPQRKSMGVGELIISPRREHSRKPDEAYERIEALCDGPYLEMFARHRRERWDAWGDEIKEDAA